MQVFSSTRIEFCVFSKVTTRTKEAGIYLIGIIVLKNISQAYQPSLQSAMPSRRVVQKATRKVHEDWIVKKLSRALKSESHQNRMRTTDRLLPQGTLRRGSLRVLFAGWIKQYLFQGRVFTVKLAKQVCYRLRSKFGLSMEDPDGIKEEYLRVHNLLKVARKRQIGKPGKGKAMSSMDNLETLPLAPWDGYALNQDHFSQ